MSDTILHNLRNFCYTSHTFDQNVITLNTSGEVKLQIIPCAPDVLRIWVDPNGAFQKPKSYAIENESFYFNEYKIRDDDTTLSVCTSECIITINKNPLSITLFNNNGDLIMSEHKDNGIGWGDDGSVFMYNTMHEDEHFYGLGQDNDAYHGNLDRRGTTRDMITGQSITKGCVTADLPITFFMSTGIQGRGYGMFLDNSYHSEFNMGEQSNDYYFFNAEGGELIFYLFVGPRFDKILNRYTDLTGKPSMLPLWAMGYIQSKCTYRDWDDMDEVIDTFRQKQIPMDCIVIDADWPEYMVNFKFDPRFEDKSGERISYHIKENGVKFMLSTSGPMIKKDSSNFQSGLEAGIFATDGKGHTMTCGWYGGELMDFTSPNMKSWLMPQMKPLYDMGVQAWWLDLIEPEGEPLQTVYQVGERARVHNAFALLNTKIYYEIHKEFDKNSRPFILGRTATAGIQKFGSVTWTGDVYSDYDTLQAHCPEALNTAMSGIPTWTSDTSGFISSTNDPSLDLPAQLYKNDTAAQALLYERWMQFSCFTPITRSHHVGPCEPYAHGDMVEGSAKRYLKLRYRLIPYIYTYAYNSHKNGISIMRPLIFNYQNDKNVINIKDEFMFGNELLVAPVLNEHSTSRKVYFPEGRWIDYDFGYIYDGGKSYIVYAPQSRIPVFAKSGSIIPMAPEMNFTDERPWDIITLDIFPNKHSEFTMYQDDGYTDAFENGEFTSTVFTCDAHDKSITISVNHSNNLFVPKTYELVIHMEYNPVNVDGLTQFSHHSKLNHAGKGWFYDRHKRILYILLTTNNELTYKINVDLGDRLYIPCAPELDENGKPIAIDEIEDSEKQMPYFLPASTLPCKIQLENYDRGGEGIAYHMLTKGNTGNIYRKDDVNINLSTDDGGGYMLTSIYPGEWLEYSVNVEQAGYYDIMLRVSTEDEGCSFHVQFNDKNLTGKVSIPNTGGFDKWQTVKFDHIKLAKGEQIIRLVLETGIVNMNYLEISIS